MKKFSQHFLLTLTLDGRSCPSLIYIRPYLASFTHFDRHTLSTI